ncbi:MAG: sterol desaturase family protein [Granulosicoccus sp.]|nr:sterol desaturase family protein [Granulosicoccus sp.]
MPKESDHVYKPRQILPEPERELRLGEGRISGYLALSLGALSFFGVLCYRYPTWLTTPELRAAYDPETLRVVLAAGLWLSFVFCLLTFMLQRNRTKGAIGALLSVAAIAIGGHEVTTGQVHAAKLSLGLDWLILSLLASAVIFIFLEKVFPKYRDQPILRSEWKLDLVYFCFNHLLVVIFLLIGNYFVATVFGWAVSDRLQNFLQELPIAAQVVILILCADFVLYWSHRTFHEVSWLWPVHAVHHSVEHMDWLAGSRNHVLQAIVDRTLAMVPLYLLGTDKLALDIYVSFAALQAVFVHANIGIPFGPLKYIIATPQYHHWHHSTDRPAIDTNYAVHTPLFDRLFGTYHMPVEHWPEKYGTTRRLPRTFFGQLFYPFRR